MSRRLLAGSTAAVCGVLALAFLSGSSQALRAPEKEARETFGLAKVWAIHLDIPAKEYEALTPTGGFGFPGGPAPGPSKEKEKRPRDRNLFGLEFPWVHGDLTAGGKTYKKVGLRYDGNATYFASARDVKRPFRIDLDKHKKQHFEGLTTINLHPGALDPTRGREALAYAVFRAAGL